VFDIANHYTKTESDNRYLRPDTVNPSFTDTGALGVPTGTTAERPSSPITGQIRFNTDENSLEQYDSTEWGSIGGTGATEAPELSTTSISINENDSGSISINNYNDILIYDTTTSNSLVTSSVSNGNLNIFVGDITNDQNNVVTIQVNSTTPGQTPSEYVDVNVTAVYVDVTSDNAIQVTDFTDESFFNDGYDLV